ncbi:hypothetical protein ASG32_30390 [Methylobacterium sp. Leaf361]|uniref:NAD-dependent epimerase/dehydratase family protein n=1 Tax=Methylobacterium sp. Leaf361 TaxID=1736352 RepID=UPI0006FABD2F|nr:NAD(P)-dependent oxidoreductase [Methylobacterium sp. Leaf361]KQS67599.1 hypothetical protein ASG32_30390 [Methylobacterium sp. Leaf361]
MRLAITGATGFLGANLCANADAAGHKVSAALGTDPTRGAKLAAQGVPFVAAHLADVDAMARAFRGADAVAHCAARSTAWGSRAAFEADNVAGTANVVAACRRAGVPRLLHISSASVYFELADREDVREDSRLPSPFNEYARSKVLSEAKALQFEGDVAILRPRGIFGPGDPTLVPRLARAARRGRLPLLRGGTARASLTHVDAVSSAILAAATAPAPLRATYNVAHVEAAVVRDLVERVMAALGRPFTWRRIPMPVALAAARASETAAAVLGGREPAATPYALGLLAHTHTLDTRAIREDLGWTSPLTLEEGLCETMAWLEAHRCP